MPTFKVYYSDNSMIDHHLAPYERVFKASNDASISRDALQWIASLHKIAPGSITLESHMADDTDVIDATTREAIGQIGFRLIDDE